MKDSFLTHFSKKAEAAHKKGSDCFKNKDHIGFLTSYFEEGYYRTLAFAVNGQKQEDYKNEDGLHKIIVDKFWFYFKVEKQGNSRVTQVLKKAGMIEKVSEIETVINNFFNDLSLDIITLSDKSTQIYNTLMNMSTAEKIEKGLTSNANNEVDAVDKLFIDDNITNGIIKRRKSAEVLKIFIKQIHEILAQN
jgi:hypothetical protein